MWFVTNKTKWKWGRIFVEELLDFSLFTETGAFFFHIGHLLSKFCVWDYLLQFAGRKWPQPQNTPICCLFWGKESLCYIFNPLATSIALRVNVIFNATATKVIWFDIYQDFLVVHQPCLYFLWCFHRIKSMHSIFSIFITTVLFSPSISLKYYPFS